MGVSEVRCFQMVQFSYNRARRRPPIPPVRREITQISANTAATTFAERAFCVGGS